MYKSIPLILFLLLTALLNSCKKFVELDPPKTSLLKETVFSSDNTAISLLASTYSGMAEGYASGGAYSVSFLSSLSSGETVNYNPYQGHHEFGNHTLQETSSILSVSSGPWAGAYESIYGANTILEGLSTSSFITPALKLQLEGEAKFIRAFAYFYLINLFGDVPLNLTTDYRLNASMPRAPKDKVFDQITNDLKDAKTLLSTDYSFSAEERARPNKWAAAALLARVYLYNKNWIAAESEATEVISSPLYHLSMLNEVFLKNSAEAIWQLSRTYGNTMDAYVYYMEPSYGTPGYSALRESFYQSFENNDQRKLQWIGTCQTGTGTYRFPYKYKNTNAYATPITEYSMVLRLAEQFLVRAEARAQQGKLTGTGGAAGDIDTLRKRAGLLPVNAVNAADMLKAVERERRFELFTEGGHYWLDLKRTGQAPAVMPLTDSKWKGYMELYPIPRREIQNNPSLTTHQNPGY